MDNALILPVLFALLLAWLAVVAWWGTWRGR